MMTVTIAGEDATSGIEHFVYNYRNASGVSAVNAQLLEAAIVKSGSHTEWQTFYSQIYNTKICLTGKKSV